MRQPDMTRLLQMELSEAAAGRLPTDLVRDVLGGMSNGHKSHSKSLRKWREAARRAMPGSVHTVFQSLKHSGGFLLSVDNHVLAFRLYIYSRMSTILEEDARLLHRVRGESMINGR